MHTQPLTTVAAAVLLGVIGQALASLTRLPSIVFLLGLGLAFGPFGLGAVQPAELGAGLPALTSAFVAIILFEGGLTLRPRLLREAAKPVRRLLTWGAVITLVGAATLAHFLAELPWSLAILFASLVVVTGPTVIAPILRRVPLTPRLHAVLKSESILIDPIGVFIAAVTLQYVGGVVGSAQAGWVDTVLGFVSRMGVGAIVGAAAGAIGAGLARFRLFHRADNEHLVNLGALGLALAAYVIAEWVQPEAGVMAVIVLGLILAFVQLPFREELEKFKEHLTTLGVSILFILLAADLNLGLLLSTGWQEVALLAGLLLVVRPVAVFLSTHGTTLTWREQAYLGLVAPRGIVAAAMASYCAAQLRERGFTGANRLELLVFLTIGTTVLIQGSWAALLASLLRVRARQPEGTLIVGVNDWSLTLARELRSWGRYVLFLDVNALSCDSAREQGFEAHEADATDPAVYADVDLSKVGLLVAMTPNDAVNTLACEAAGSWLGDENVLQVVSKPAGESARPRVRMAGRWALPTPRSHREVSGLLREGRLRLETQTLGKGMVVSEQLTASQGGMVPLLLLDGARIHIAASGHVCAAGAVLIGLVVSQVNEEPERRAA